jgi:ferritin-like metal-binding protein YciE
MGYRRKTLPTRIRRQLGRSAVRPAQTGVKSKAKSILGESMSEKPGSPLIEKESPLKDSAVKTNSSISIQPLTKDRTMKLETLQDLYIEELKDLYDAENQLLKAIPKMAKAATSPDLKNAFEDHLQVTQSQVDRLEQIFDALGTKAKGKKCKAMEGLIAEAKELLDQDAEEDVLDAGLIVAAQKIEHYEIAGYGSVRTYAEQLGRDEDAELLQQSLEEEKETDEQLSDLAMECINIEAEEPEPHEEKA